MTVQDPPTSAVTPAPADDPSIEQKRVEHYAATVNAWYATTLEHDKSLFALAGGGIGIMISLLTTVGFEHYWILVFFMVAIAAFLVCLGYLLKIFEGNRDYLIAIIEGKHQGADARLKAWDKVSKYSFFIGVIFATLVGLSTAALKISNKQMAQTQMANQNPTPSNRSATLDSVQGAAKLQPLGKSFQGAANLAPAQATPASGSATSASAPVSAQPVSAPAAASAPGSTAPAQGAKP